MPDNTNKKNRFPINHELQTSLSVYTPENPDTGEISLTLRRHRSVQTVIVFGLEENQPEFEEMLNCTDKWAVEYHALKMYRCSKENEDSEWKIVIL